MFVSSLTIAMIKAKAFPERKAFPFSGFITGFEIIRGYFVL